MPKHDKNDTRKKNFRPLCLMNIVVKNTKQNINKGLARWWWWWWEGEGGGRGSGGGGGG